MRYRDINLLKNTADQVNWGNTKNNHYIAFKGLSSEQRKKYITNNPDWNVFQKKMLEISHNKCWYSEAPIGSSDFEVDHFRPKNCSKNHDSKILKENGYYWKAYDWENYRLSGGLINKRRRDRLNPLDEVKGKGDYFPLDLKNGRAANDEESTSCELPILLDPSKRYDVSLLTFDENGEPIPASDDQEEIFRAEKSIFFYHLDLEQLSMARKIVWDDCVSQIRDAKLAIDDSPTLATKRIMIDKCYNELAKLLDDEKRAFTSVAKACILLHAELDGYIWLKNLARTL